MSPALPPHRTRRLLSSARLAAREIGAWVFSHHHHDRRPKVQCKGVGDFVTAVDLGAERRLSKLLAARHPEHGFLGEETGGRDLERPLVWVVDPLDGTSNFAHARPDFGVSVACLYHGQPVAAAVACAPQRVVYSAGLGLGAFCGRRRLQLPPGALDPSGMIGLQWLRGRRRLAFLPTLLDTGVRIRNLGSTVVQLCDVAAGRLDANLQEQGKIWDIAAAGLIVTEAGGRFTDWSGRDLFPFESLDSGPHHPSLAAAPAVHRRLCRLLEAHEGR